MANSSESESHTLQHNSTGKAASTLELTAYLTACSRASDTLLSQDSFAKLWVPDAAWKVHREYLATVSKWEAKLLCLRNRYFLNQMNHFFSSSAARKKLINIAAGFMSYPFLMDASVETVEIDSPSVVEEKKRAVTNLVIEKKLPARKVDFLGLDLAAAGLPGLLSEIETPADEIFFLLEGITYYLPEEALRRLFTWIKNYPATKKRIAFVYWPPEMEKNKFVKEYTQFLRRKTSDQTFRFTFFNIEDVRSWIGPTKQISQTNFLQLGADARLTPCFTLLEEIFGEDFATIDL